MWLGDSKAILRPPATIPPSTPASRSPSVHPPPSPIQNLAGKFWRASGSSDSESDVEDLGDVETNGKSVLIPSAPPMLYLGCSSFRRVDGGEEEGSEEKFGSKMAMEQFFVAWSPSEAKTITTPDAR